jgi:hypothetical protein
MALDIFFLSLNDDAGTGAQYDVAVGFVVVAATPARARGLVYGECGDECGCSMGKRDACLWGETQSATVARIGYAVEGQREGVVLRSFRAG